MHAQARTSADKTQPVYLHYLEIKTPGIAGGEAVYQIALDHRALFNLRTNPIDPLETGTDLLKKLLERGGVYNDRGDIPSIQNFDTNGRITLKCYGRAGQLHDPTANIPAVQHIDPQTGKIYSATSYKHGGSKKELHYTEVDLLNFMQESPQDLPDYLKRYAPITHEGLA